MPNPVLNAVFIKRPAPSSFNSLNTGFIKSSPLLLYYWMLPSLGVWPLLLSTTQMLASSGGCPLLLSTHTEYWLHQDGASSSLNILNACFSPLLLCYWMLPSLGVWPLLLSTNRILASSEGCPLLPSTHSEYRLHQKAGLFFLEHTVLNACLVRRITGLIGMQVCVSSRTRRQLGLFIFSGRGASILLI